ncbi:MAG: hypothetical protein CVU52_04520 [Deltaproteobacteria bacterium HGW-Deltaproteobacteria-10]|nr:MAG: hypothetical protein CVU52_04520 [Deltaproteobacteria bacterium HGW-Deltaproteobacteria-10]
MLILLTLTYGILFVKTIIESGPFRFRRHIKQIADDVKIKIEIPTLDCLHIFLTSISAKAYK